MTTNTRTQCSNEDKQENCLCSENYWSSECIGKLDCSSKMRNHKQPSSSSSSLISSPPSSASSSSSNKFYPIDFKYLTSKHQHNRISQSSNNQKSALAQCKSNNTISSCNNKSSKCKNVNENSLVVKIIQNCQEVVSKRCTMPTILSQTTLMLLCTLLFIIGSRVEGAVTKDGICQSKDIRNQPSELNSLKDCRVIEGFLMITLIDRYNDTDYDNLTFPNLVEITDFLLLYRVQGLKSLVHLFPNLRVIRGNNLVNNYALIVYEMLQLTEIGLKSLTTIMRGYVRIEKNPLLCFVDTINWEYIANGTKTEDHYFGGNKNPNECLVCPTGKKEGEENDKNGSTDVECPTSKQDNKKRFCWNTRICQKICPDSCGSRSCDDNLKCCDETCLGSCHPMNAKNCTVCRNLSMGPLYNRQCVDQCGPNLFVYEQRRCITRNECWNISKPFATGSDNLSKNPFIPFNGTCAHTCPKYHTPDGDNGQFTCKSCNGECKKICHGSTVDSLAVLQNYRGCAIITGSLILQIRQGGQNVIRELESSLSEIEEIEGALKIIRCYPLISLSFLKKLRVIKGIKTQENYALYVMDNQNLQHLFDHPVKIERGKMFFHFNSKLCYYQIEALKKDINEMKDLAKIPIEDVAINSNGDKVPCSISTLTASPSSVMHIGAVIDITPLKYEDSRTLLGYVLHYKQAPYRNVSMYDSRDACGGDGWRVEDSTQFDRKAPVVQIVLTSLKPYTQYAYYVKTYTIATEPMGGQTPIQYFRTSPWQPGSVQKMRVATNGSSSILVNWEPPKVSNGELTNYIIKASLIYDDAILLQQRNYCEEPLGKFEDKAILLPPVQQSPVVEAQPECACPEDDEFDTPMPMPHEKNDQAQAEQVINFENEIQNIVYVKRTFVVTGEEPKKERRRRNIDGGGAGKYSNQSNTNQLLDVMPEDVFPTSQRTIHKENSVDDFTESIMKDGYYTQFYFNKTNASTHSFTLDKLRHFSTYSVSVLACRDFNSTEFHINTHCSNAVMLNIRTEKIANADDIPFLEQRRVGNSNNSSSMVKLYWPEPKDPNGLILSYTIVYKRVDLDSVKPTEQCITRHLHNVSNGEIPLLSLSNGNYSVSVRATSLAGDGHPTAPQFVIIDDPRMSTATIAMIILGVFILLGLIIYGVWFYFRRKFGSPVSDLKLIASVNPEYVGMQYEVDEWEIPRDNVIQIGELGQGSFGMVYEGLVRNKDGENVPCAIKTVNENATDRERINFLKEAGVMKAFDTHHVVRLLGVVSITQPTLVVMELMVNGDLKGYLRSHRPDADDSQQPIGQPPSLKRILQMALEIADGMAYLSAKKFVHRDLAARNCMVADDLTVKIGDFGMTRDIYETDYYRKGTKGLLPVRWMAPESLKDGVFTSSSDVFSYGIVLWEIATGASQPYQGLSNDQVLRYVIDGGVMERPENCPEKLYRLMCKTWQHRPSSRPTFLQIVGQLLDDAAPSFRKLSFYHTQEAQELLQHPANRGMVIDVTTPLKAEEDDFSLDDLAADAFLMSDVRASQTDGGASHSPLRSSFGIPSLLKTTTQNPSSVNSANTISILNRNGGQLHRGLEFLRNTFLNKNGSGGNTATDNESPEYRKLQTMKTTKTTAEEQQQPLSRRNNEHQMTVVGIEDNVGAIKRQNLSNGFVVGDKTDLD